MEAPGRVREPRASLILSCRRTSIMNPPVGGTFWFQIFIQASSQEIWSQTISGSEEVLAGKWGGLFWVTSFRKKFIGSRGEAPCVASIYWRWPATRCTRRRGELCRGCRGCSALEELL